MLFTLLGWSVKEKNFAISVAYFFLVGFFYTWLLESFDFITCT